MRRTVTFIVNIEQQTVDGCGNEVKKITEGEVRSAICKALDDRNVQSVYVTDAVGDVPPVPKH